jgi:beta-glucosidase
VGINYYTRSIVKRDGSIRGYAQVAIPNVERTHIGWEVFPDGLETVLKLLHKDWPQQAWYITENGAATDDTVENGECLDQQRLNYFQTHLAAVDRAIEGGVPVKGYYAWSLMDNFEWAEGYTKRFGIVHVDFETQKRTAKQSALAFKEFLRSDKQVQA